VKSTLVTAVGVAALGVMSAVGPACAADTDGTWEVRLRGVHLNMHNSSDAYAPLAIPEDAIHVNNRWIPDLDLEHFITPHLSAELVLTYPQAQTVTVEKSALGGPTAIGTFKHLPPTLTAKWNFLPGSAFQPYIGAGVNLTLLSKVNLNVPTVGRLDLENHSIGPAAQAGFDYRVADHWFVNADFKWVMLRTDVRFQGTKISEARLDPLLLGFGVGYRF
jgi:outer membrane protein